MMKHNDSLTAQNLFFAVCGGVLLTCAFPGIGIAWCAWFAIVFLLAAIAGATGWQAFYLGIAFGFAHFVTLLYWLVPTMHRYGPLSIWLSIGCLFLLAFYLALYAALFSVIIAKCCDRPASCLWMVPVVWVGLEYARTYLFTGFPWELLGYSQYHFLGLIQIADIFGVYGLSFIIAFANAVVFLCVWFLASRRWHGRRITPVWPAAAVVMLAVIIAGTMVYGRYRIAAMDRLIAKSDRLKVSVIQGNIPETMKWDSALQEKIIHKYISLSRRVKKEAPDLVVWPETAVPFYFFYDTVLTEQILSGVRQVGTYFLVGSPSFEYRKNGSGVNLYNTAYLIDPKGQVIGKYDKVHLVPFGEYVPLGKWLPFIGKMVPAVGDFTPGTKGRVLHMGKVKIGTQICYEIIFPDLSAAMARQGANLLVNITNDAWFGKTAAPFQHFSMAIFRAVENRRALVRDANTGISGFIDPVGRVIEMSALFKTTVMTRSVPIITGHRSYYTEHGDQLPIGCTGVVVLLIALAGIRWQRGRKRH